MKASIQIPKGWRRLRAGENDIPGDRFFNPHLCEWTEVKVGGARPEYQPNWPCIRRVKRKRAKLSGLVEVSREERDRLKFSPTVYRYTDKTGKGHMTFEEWMRRSDLRIHNTRFWLRRGAR